MSDVAAGPGAGGRAGGTGPRPGGSPPPVLLAALVAALLIAVSLSALLMQGGGGGGGVPIRPASASAPAEADSVVLSVTFAGDGEGKIEIAPGGLSCSQTCEHRFEIGTRLTVTTDAANGSTFDEWGESCAGDGECTFSMGEDRALTVSFRADELDGAPECGGDPGDDELACEEPAEPATTTDCDDGEDNDGDGLTDSRQDPDCVDGDDEAGRSAPASTAPAVTNECADGRDNDSDGLTDTAQDPDCLTGGSETGAPASAGTSRPRADCRDGKDNDGDGLTDTAQDPGCEGDSSELD